MSDLGDDPRRTLRADREAMASDEPPLMVARGRRGLSLWVGIAVLAVLAVVVFAGLSANRKRLAEQNGPDDGLSAPTTSVGAAPAPQPLPAPLAPTTGPLINVPAPQFTTDNRVPLAPPPMTMAAIPTPMAAALPQGATSLEQRRRAPAVVVDLGSGEGGARAPAATGASVAPPRNPLANPSLLTDAGGNRTGVSDEERFAERVGAAEPDRVRATQLRNLSLLVPQGATISATLETALDSDLPGYARAVVSRDVKGFDGALVLIPRGSRVIGQYKSGVALGASRVFVIWTRIIRPDGASIQVASPGADDLGRAGLTGKVDRHFFTRFGGAILLSVLNAGVAALSNLQTNAQVFIGSSSDASNVAAAALQKDGSAAPTIRTPQGAAVSIFVARDLDFSPVGPAQARWR